MVELKSARRTENLPETVYAELEDSTVKQEAQIVPEDPLSNDTPLPDDLREAMMSSHKVCVRCKLHNANRPVAVGEGVKARCTGFAEPDDGDIYFKVIGSPIFNQAKMRIVGSRDPNSQMPAVPTPCGITPVDIFVSAS